MPKTVGHSLTKHGRPAEALAKAGGDERGRTADLMNAIHALYQLSYIPKNLFQKTVLSYAFSYIKLKDLKQNGKYLPRRMFMLTQKMNCLFVMLSCFSLSAAQKALIKASSIDEKNVALAITIPLDQDQYLYADYIQISVNNPSVTLSPYKSSVEPVMKYDPIFKENRKIIEQTPTISLTATKQSKEQLPETYIRLIYYTNKAKTAVENLFPLNFQLQKQDTVKEQPTIVSQPAKESISPSQPEAKAAGTPTSWLDYLKNTATKSQLLWVRILIAFLLGLLLSLTPCIYPMIPITIGIIQAQSATSLWHNFSLALAYTMGIATTFAFLGLAAALAGHAFGSFMNNPIVIILIVSLLIYSALSLFGLYEIRIPKFLQGRSIGKGGSFVAAFLFGAASGTIASPCLSPGLLFMLTLVATLKSIWAGFILLFVFAVGLSIPLLIVGTFSGSLNLLPQAGSWMIEIKYLFGFMLLGMCFYFLSGVLAWPLLLVLFAAFLFGSGVFYIYHARSLAGSSWRLLSNILGMAFIASSVFIAIKAAQVALMPAQTMPTSRVWLANYNEALQQAIQTHKKLFIFVHAPRCGACKEIEEQLKTANSLASLAKVVAMQVDLSKDSDIHTKTIVQTFTILGAPVCILIDPQTQKVIARWDGELDHTQFDDMIRTIKQQ